MTRVDVIAAVIRRNGRVLLGLRPRHKRHGALWEFPGGKLNAGESWLDAAQRELHEELGVDVSSVGEVLASIQDRESIFRICFVPVAIVGEPEAHEHDELRWASAAEIRGLRLAPADHEFSLRYFVGS